MPHQCPGCGRFLSNALVEGLATASADCPRCGRGLTTADFDGAAASGPPDPLEGWDGPDAGVAPPAVGRSVRDRMPDGTVLGLVGLIGAVLGALMTRRRSAGALLGAFAGLLAGAVERRLWEGRW